jgi:5'-deoxynucleotidase YfbR-like HD superfamily hydrolase
VAEHAFNVARIAEEIAADWFGVQYQSDQMLAIMRIALHHDDDEALTGDIPAPAKKFFVEGYLDKVHSLCYDASDQSYAIVKLADLMEAYWFLTMEFRLGNGYNEVHRARIRNQLVDFIQGHFYDSVLRQFYLWHDEVNTHMSEIYD